MDAIKLRKETAMASTPVYPIKVLDDFLTLKNTCRDFVKTKSILLSVVFGDDYTIYFHEKFNKYNFSFKIFNPGLGTDHRTYISVAYHPESTVSNNETIRQIEISTIISYLDIWVSLVERHYKHHPEILQLEEFTQLYFEDLKIYDEDAETAPFHENQQKVLFYTADCLENVLRESENQDEKNHEIIIEIQSFKNDLQHLPKNSLMRKWAKIHALVRLQGIPFSKKIWGLAQEACIKYMIERGVDAGINWGIRLLHYL